ncbi:hypothetical protein [Actinacidiphila sp. bgisy144]|uniref:hypothetical protein n=1 Tax=Actinacidiphila sp. bgisy144 TaxID=3413791 RepID=UPI003EBD4634
MPQDLTVGYLLQHLQNLDPNLRVRIAVNPDFPFAHFLGTNLVINDGLVYLVEDGQEGYLPTAVSDRLSWA